MEFLPILFFRRFCFLLLLVLRTTCQNSTERTAANKELNICWIWEEDTYYGSYQRIAPAVDLAIEHMNSFVLPKNLKLNSIYQSSGRSCSKTMYSVVDQVAMLLFQKGIKCHAFLGASCSFTAAALYGFTDRLKIPLLGVPAVGWWSIQPSAEYKDFSLGLILVFGYNDTSAFLSQFLKYRNYTDMTVFRDESYDFFTTFAENVMRFMKVSNPVVFKNTVVKQLSSASNESYRELLQSANERSRVFLLMIHGDAIRQMMITASELGYTKGDHVFICFELYDNPSWGKVWPLRDDLWDEVAMDAFRSLFLISFNEDETSYNKAFEKEVKLRARENYNYTYDPLEKLDPIVVGHYEAIAVYTKAVMSLFKDDMDITNGTLVVKRVTNSAYEAFRGTPVYVNSNRQRDKNYDIKMYDHRTHDFEVFIEYRPHSANNIVFHEVKEMIWPSSNGKLPPNEPQCGFRNDKCKETGLPSSSLAAAIVVPLLFMFLFIAGGAWTLHKFWKIQESLNPDWWKINVEELNVKTLADGLMSRSLESHSTIKTNETQSSATSDPNKEMSTYRGEKVSLVAVGKLSLLASNNLVAELNLIRQAENNNLVHLFGIGLDVHQICQYIVYEACAKGSLSTIFENEMIKLDWYFKNSLIRDIVYGMAYLHSTEIGSHGNLTSNTCLIDVRFTVKIADYGLPFFRTKSFLEPLKAGVEDRDLLPLLWRAPELLRTVMPPKGTQKGDVYSFSIILQQIILRAPPFELPGDRLDMTKKQILTEVIADNIPPVRPRVPRSACSNELYDLMERCWEEMPIERPTFARIKDRLRKVVGNIGENLVDLLLKRMEEYANDLERKVAEQTQQFLDEKARSEQLLSELLPKSIAASLTRGVAVPPEKFESVSIFFSDIVGFTTIAAKGSPMEVVDLLNGLYTFFDNTLVKYDVYKVETIGDAYMVASGLPITNGNRHAAEIAKMAIDLQENIGSFVLPNNQKDKIQIRAGINSGPCVAGIVGLKMPRYCVFGDTVNTASRMESTGEPGKVQITDETKYFLESIGGFTIIERGYVNVKGKGKMQTYWLL